ncbi:peptidylprolyl isomerase [Calditrichota bacterium GD2]
MKAQFKITIIAAVIFFTGFTACKKELKLDEHTVAIVGEYAIPFEQYKNRYQEYLDVTYQKDNLFLRLGVLRNMINEILLKHYDDNRPILNSEEYQNDQEWVKKEMLLAYLKEDDIYSKIRVTDQEAREAFVRLNEKIAARHLYAPTEEEANRLYELLMKGASFDSLAREVFTDSTLRSNGGYLGYFTWGDMDPAFEDAAYQMKIGEISKPVKTAQGYSIIKIEDRKRVPILTETEYVKKKGQIIRFIKISKRKPAEKKYLQKVVDLKAFQFDEQAVEELLTALKDKQELEQEAKPIDLSKTVVRYKTEKWNGSELLKAIKKIPSYHRDRIDSSEKLKAAIKGLIVNHKLLKIAEQKDYARLPEVKHALANAKNNLYLKYKRKYILQNATVPDSILQQYYRKNIWKFKEPRKINVREILVADLQTALKIKKQLLDGADFAQLARKYSLRGWTAQNGGETGYAELDRFGKLKDKFWNTPVGKIIGPLKIENVYGLFRVEGKIDAQPVSFGQIKDQVEEEYKGENQTEIMRAYLQKLRKKVKIERNLDLVKSFVLDNKE